MLRRHFFPAFFDVAVAEGKPENGSVGIPTRSRGGIGLLWIHVIILKIAGLTFLKPMDQPPFLFIRLMVYAIVRHKFPLFALLDDLQLPRRVAFGGFFVEQRRVFGGAALRGQGNDSDFPAQLVFADGQLRPDLDFFTGFDALFVDVDFAAADSFGGERAGLEKPRRPQPFI